MIQRNYRSETREEWKWNLEEIAESEEYQKAKSVLVQVFVESWNESSIRFAVSGIRAKLPKAQIMGMTACNREDYEFFTTLPPTREAFENAVLDVLFFESSTVTVKAYELGMLCEMGNGGLFGQYLHAMPQVRGVHLMAVGKGLSVDSFLTMASVENPDVIFYGERAMGRRNVPKEDPMALGCVFSADRLVKNGFVAAVLCGEDLHIRSGYNLGWTPMGKKMTITKMEGPNIVSEIDGKPATRVYSKYLGLAPAQLTVENVCEFPFGVQYGSRLFARTGLFFNDPDKVYFTAPVYEGDELQFTYGNPDVIFAETYVDAMEVARFAPQALELIGCGNRNVLLKEDVEIEHNFYSPAAPEKMVIHGESEILYDSEGGGELNSTLISIAMREGDVPKERPELPVCNTDECPYHHKTIPLVLRMTKFLEATTRDLEEEVRKAREANEAKSRFLSSVSHEIRTPINAVLGLDEMILRESSEAEIRKYAMDIQNSGRTLLSLINDILDSSRIDSGKMEIIEVDYDLSSLLNDLVNMTAVRADEKNLAFSVHVDSNMPHILFGDDTRIKQCALNILTNAVKYTETGSVEMTVSAEKEDESHISLSFSVKDTGIGIKEEDIPKLYTPFARIEEKRNRSIEGTGLGMNIVLSLLSMMDSKLDVQSTYGEGSVFSFKVTQEVKDWSPIGDFAEMYRQSVETAANYHESFQAPKARILVVDDTRMNLTVIRGLLKSTLVKIDTAESGKEALSLVGKYKYDIIFLDQRMPGMDGIETLRRMKHSYENKNHGTPVIMLTANAMAGAREMFLEEGFDDYLTKPINGKKLERAILERLPAEKVHIPTEEEIKERDASSTNDYADSPFLSALSQIQGLSVKEGLENCMNEEILRSTISDFVTAAKDIPKKVEDYLQNGNIKDYGITVHALKSSLRIIGAAGLSERAKRLEACADENNTKEIHSDTPALLADYKKLAGQLARALDGGAGKESAADEAAAVSPAEEKTSALSGDGTPALPELPEDQLKSAFGGIRELVEAFDFDGAADILRMLSGYRVNDRVKKKMELVSDRITKLERDALLKELA
ncbi:MAG: response regulator [Lachnospiraceae bacterium]|nr:response regulator [Lachnospiraceae bacterium]